MPIASWTVLGSAASRSRQVIHPLYSAFISEEYAECWTHHYKRDTKQVQRRVTKMVKQTCPSTHHSTRDWESWGCYQGEEKAQKDLSVHKYVISDALFPSKEDRLFSGVHSERTRANKHKSKHRKLHSNIRKIFDCEGGQHWNSLTRESIDSPSETFKTQLEIALSQLLWSTLH